MYGTYKTSEPMECAVCEPKRDTLAEKSKKMGYLLEDAKVLLSSIGVNMFGDAPIEDVRPEATCLEHDMCLNVAAMESLLCGLKFLAERLY